MYEPQLEVVGDGHLTASHPTLIPFPHGCHQPSPRCISARLLRTSTVSNQLANWWRNSWVMAQSTFREVRCWCGFSQNKEIYIYISWYKMGPCPFTIAWHQRSSVMSAAGLRHVAIIYTINRWSSFQIESYQPWKPTKFAIVCLLTYSIPLIIWSTHC